MTLTKNQRNWVVFFVSMLLTWAVAALYLSTAGHGDNNIRLVLRVSAVAAFVVMLVVFLARPLRQLLRRPFTAAILRNRRLIDITFAGIQTAHLGLIFYRDRQIADFDFNFGKSLLSLGGVTYLVIYLMFLTSFDATARALGAKNWRILHKIGLYLIFVEFLQTLRPSSLDEVASPKGILVLLAAIAALIRLIAFLAKR